MMEKRLSNSNEVKNSMYDSVFTSLFRDPANQLRLYRELHPEDTDVTESDIRDVTLETVLLNHIYNDLGFTVKGRTIFLLEAQSTWCPNMAFRTMLYLADTLKEYVLKTNQSYYSDRPLRLPKPELYVLYTGDKPHEEEVLSLADTHWNGDDSYIDVKVRILYGDDTDAILSQYVRFTNVYKGNLKKYGRSREAVFNTVNECIRKGILTDYMEKQKSEVIDTMMALFDPEVNLQMFANSEREQALEEGRAEGMAKERSSLLSSLAKMIQNGILTKEDAISGFSLSTEEAAMLPKNKKVK